MGLVATWLSGCGLSHAVPNFTAAGIVTPAALAELDLAHYEALGVKSADDRRKLFYLVQRIKLAVDKDKQKNDNKSQTTSIEEQVEKMVSSTSMETADEEKDEQAHGEASIEGISPKKSSSSSPVSGTSPKPRRSPSKIQQPKAQSPKMASSTNSSKTSPGETTTLISSPEKTKTDTSSKEPQNMAESSTWEDEEEDDNADDEASEVVASPVRRSNRIASKGNTNNSSAAPRTATNSRHGTRSATSATTRSANTATSTTSKTSASSRVKAPLTKAKSINNMPNPKKGFSSKSGATAGAFPRTNSKLQNPSKSLRTGKQLSTIPSDSIAAMSPLPAAKLQELPEENKTTVKQDLTSRLGGKTRHSHGGRSVSDSGSDTESKASSRSSKARSRRSVDGSSSRTIIGRVSYDSDSSANSSTSRRRSSIAAPKTESKTASTRRTSGVGTGIGQRRTVPSASSTSSQSKTVKSAVSIHGGTDAEDSSWKAQINSRRQEVNVEHELFCSDDLFHDDDDENDMQIRVAIRKRPFNADKPSDIDVLHPLEYGSFGKMLVFQPKTRVDLTKEVETVPFAFDTVFGEQYNNADIYRKSVCNLIPYVLEGSQCCCFAFGCTGSGKTFTMMGKGGGTRGDAIEEKNMGLYYMAALDIFRSLEEFEEYSHLSVGVSLFEIYGGKLFDLLNDRKPVKCLEDHKGKVQFPGLSEHCIEGPGDLMEMIELGASARSTGSTSRNAHSSRSHAVLQLHLRKDVGRKQNVEHGRLTFIDLAGSERGADTANCSRATRLEGAEINQSLLALKEVIRARARGGSMNHVPFRGSKLTQ